MRRRAAAGGSGTVRSWIARLLCVVLLVAGAVHATGGHATAHAHDDVAGSAVLDLHCAAADHADATHHADADICAVAPSCALAAAPRAPKAAVPTARADLLSGLAALPNPDPPRSLEA